MRRLDVQQAAEGGEQAVAGVVAVLVVDALEVVEVDDRGGERLALALRQRPHRRQRVVEVAAVEQPGELIARGLLAQRLLQRLHLVDLLRQRLVRRLQLGARALGGAALGVLLVELVLQHQQLGLQRRGLVVGARRQLRALGGQALPLAHGGQRRRRVADRLQHLRQLVRGPRIAHAG